MAEGVADDVAAFQILGPRRRQEDAALHVRLGSGRLLVVADGMGGEPAGDVASISAVLGFEKGFGVPSEESEDNMTWATRLMDGLRGALDGMAEALARGEGADGMATTLAAVWFDDAGMRWISVGDSSILLDDRRDDGPERLNDRHGKGNRVDSALMVSDKPFSRYSIAADFCVTEIDLHPGPKYVGPGRLILVASDGIDVLGDRFADGGWIDRKTGRMLAEWQTAFFELNPRDFLARVESALAPGKAQDNTTAIALRTPTGDGYGRPPYTPLSGAPDREVLHGRGT